tara:strand:+ start:590 stop:790 length:201 start_codon:yes stop_codon:yes gene_type:complete
MYRDKELSHIDQEFNDLTKNFDLEDWRTVRNENYWWVETSYGTKRPRSTYEKLELIVHYINKGVPK